MHTRRFFILLIGAAFIVSLLTPLIAHPQQTAALSGSQFKAGEIIDDALFYARNSMSTSEVQAFLNSKVPTCDTNGTVNKSYYYDSNTGKVNDSFIDTNGDGKNDTTNQWVTTSRATYGARYDTWYGTSIAAAPYTCLKNYKQNTPAMNAESQLCGYLSAKSNMTAAQIITDVASACGISPKVLIVLLQKEQGLVTDDWPWADQYQKATGFACPDTTGCDSTYYGFFNQVYYAARQYRKYRLDPGNYNYVAGQTNLIPYNPNSSCGKATVYIKNQATAGLYDYTPYVPNAKALSNLYGTGDSCSSYGNRNFWRYYNDWFGPTNLKDTYNFEQLSGTNNAVLTTNSTALGNDTKTITSPGNIYTFYYDATNTCLRMAHYGNGKWTDTILDGSGASLTGASTDDVGQGITAMMYGDSVQVFYYDTTAHSLRHAWTNASGWHFETLDGTTTALSKFNANVGQTPTVTRYGSSIQLFYYNADGGNLRHAWWGSHGWQFETLDGDSDALSKFDGNVGKSPTVLSYNKSIQLYYYDVDGGNLRHAWWNDKGWHFETFDGTASSLGKMDSNVGITPMVTSYNKSMQIFYYDVDGGNLRHAWWDTKWHFETLDGTTTSVFRNNDNLGASVDALQFQGDLVLFYRDYTAKSWHEAYYDETGWHNFNLDGGDASVSSSSAAVGGQLSASQYGSNSLQIFYRDSLGGLGHSWVNR